jgi:hypothetical protein
MPDKPKPLELFVAQGGRLITTFSSDNVGEKNYVEKKNMRRVDRDKEGRREGWFKFRPDTVNVLGSQHLNSGSRQTLLVEAIRPNGERVVVVASKTTIKKFDYATRTWTDIGTGFSANGKRWQWCTVNGYLILNNAVDLPVSYRVEDAAVVPIYELREAGIASVGFIDQAYGYLLLANIVEIQATQLAGIMNGGTGGPYGIITDATKLNHITWKVINGEYGRPRDWAIKIDVVMAAASSTITLPWTSTVFVANTTKVAVLNGGPNGGVLGGQSDSTDGVLVTGVAANVLTLAKSTDVGLTYPRTVTVMRWADQSSLVGYYPLQDDSSPIIGFKTLNNQPIVYRSTRIFVGRHTGVLGAPFDFKRRYEGGNVPKWPDAIVSVGELGDGVHLYPAEGGRFYTFDGIGPDPVLHKVCDDARNLIFDGTTPASDVWAINNPLTKEVWFCRPGKVMAFDYEFNTASEIDAEIHAAAFVQRPNSTDKWFIIAIEGVVYTYGLVKTAEVETVTYHRDGVNAIPSIKFGLTSLGSATYEKTVHGYVALLGSGTPDITLELKLWSINDAQETPDLILTDAINGSAWDLFFQEVYFQDQLRVTSAADVNFQLVGRAVYRSMVGSHAITRPRS